jgi:thiopeptide-type bacteriocin biosynthesis protein
MHARRRFIFGQEWLYVKLYSGPAILEEILIAEILPIIKYFYSGRIIDKFFFVRYFDDEYNIRLRFRLSNSDKLHHTLDLLSQKISPYSDRRILSKVVIDTYDREIERYGSNIIEQIETIFSVNSWQILNILAKESDYHLRWLSCTNIFDSLLGKFGLTTREKYNLFQNGYLTYLKECGNEKSVIDCLRSTYREHKEKINEYIGSEYNMPTIPDSSLTECTLNDAINDILKLNAEGKLDVGFEKLLTSIMHMYYNRVFRTKQRTHELAIYYMMSNFYKSQLIIAQKL